MVVSLVVLLLRHHLELGGRQVPQSRVSVLRPANVTDALYTLGQRILEILVVDK